MPLINGVFHNQFAVFMAIDARPQSLIAGNLITSFISNTPALTYSFQPQPLVVRPSADDTVVINSKPTVVYKTPKRIIYRKITCYRYHFYTFLMKFNCSTCHNVRLHLTTPGFSSPKTAKTETSPRAKTPQAILSAPAAAATAATAATSAATAAPTVTGRRAKSG